MHRYRRNNNLEKQLNYLDKTKIVYTVSCKFLYTPVSSIFKSHLTHYILKTAFMTNQDLMNDSEVRQSRGMYSSRRRDPRIDVTSVDTIKIDIDGYKDIKLIDLSAGGFKFETREKSRYIDPIMCSVELIGGEKSKSYKASICFEIRNISLAEVNE